MKQPLFLLVCAIASSCAPSPKPCNAVTARDGTVSNKKSAPPTSIEYLEVSDTFEEWNRSVFAFNELVEKCFLGPVVKVYDHGIPKFLRTGFQNMVETFTSPVYAVAALFQGNFTLCLAHVTRFFVNTFFGMMGCFDLAKKTGLVPQKQTFFDVLESKRVPHGSFFILPFLGPTTAREALGKFIDASVNPFAYTNPFAYYSSYYLYVYATYLPKVKHIRKNFSDPYEMTRTLYLQSLGAHLKSEKATRGGDLSKESKGETLQDVATFPKAPAEDSKKSSETEDSLSLEAIARGLRHPLTGEASPKVTTAVASLASKTEKEDTTSLEEIARLLRKK